MPKKFKGENSKAAVAKARKQEVRDAENVKKEKEKEDEYWRDDDKHCANKQKRKVGLKTHLLICYKNMNKKSIRLQQQTQREVRLSPQLLK